MLSLRRKLTFFYAKSIDSKEINVKEEAYRVLCVLFVDLGLLEVLQVLDGVCRWYLDCSYLRNIADQIPLAILRELERRIESPVFLRPKPRITQTHVLVIVV